MKWLFAALSLFCISNAYAADIPWGLTTPFDLPVSSTPCEPAAWPATPGAPLPATEELNFVLRWGVITGGRADLYIQGRETLHGRTAYHIASRAHSTGVVNTFYKVVDQSEGWLDTASLLTLRYQKSVREGAYRILEAAEFDQACRRYVQISRRFDVQRDEERQGRLPPGTMDVFGSLYFLRTQPLAVGQMYQFNVLSGDKLWPMSVHVLKRETVHVPAGKFDCFLLEPTLRQPGIFVAKGKKVEVWVTAEPPHTPVRMRSEVVIGHVAAELTKRKETP